MQTSFGSRIVTALRTSSRILEHILRSRVFALNLLAQGQEEMVQHFFQYSTSGFDESSCHGYRCRPGKRRVRCSSRRPHGSSAPMCGCSTTWATTPCSWPTWSKPGCAPKRPYRSSCTSHPGRTAADRYGQPVHPHHSRACGRRNPAAWL
ncbi:MAG: flavin reductase [Anaerolineae bacterium]|nr:MAG: flavin reductase [Anaerolineae bacterium]